MSRQQKRNQKSKPKANNRRKVEAEAKKIVKEATKQPRARRPRQAKTKFALEGFGAKAAFSHDWGLPASIGNVTQTTKRRHSMRIAETELVDDIRGNPTAAAVIPVAQYINPGRIELFPWLSQLSGSFEMYKFHKLRFKFQPSCGTTETGVVTMSIDYDSLDTMTTEQQMMSSPGAKQGSTFVSFEIDAISGGRSKFAKDLFIDPDGVDVTTALGRFYLAVTGTTSASTVIIGRLYVDYEVELIITQIATAGVLNGRTDAYVAANATTTDLLDGITQHSNSSKFTIPDDSATPARLRFRYPGRYFLQGTLGGTTGAYNPTSVTWTASPTGTITTSAAFGSSSAAYQTHVWYWEINVLAVDAYLTATTVTGAGTLDFFSCFIFPINAYVVISKPDPRQLINADPKLKMLLEYIESNSTPTRDHRYLQTRTVSSPSTLAELPPSKGEQKTRPAICECESCLLRPQLEGHMPSFFSTTEKSPNSPSEKRERSGTM